MLEIDILRNSSHSVLGVLKGYFRDYECPNCVQTPLLAKTMIARLGGRLCVQYPLMGYIRDGFSDRLGASLILWLSNRYNAPTAIYTRCEGVLMSLSNYRWQQSFMTCSW